MKKAILLLASAALLLVGCAKEKFAEPNDGGLTSVTFSARVDGGVATKASADLDGKGANVNRCIMEIYFQDQLYKRMEAAMSGTPATATFSNVPVVAGKQYEILFWADNVDVVNTEEGLAPDKYYTTKTEENNVGLKAVAIKQAAFLAALEAGDNDELDAFYGAKKYTVPQAGGSFSITLHRPFAQMNVITTDVASGKTVISADLLPETVTVSYTAATTFNVADSLASGSTTYTYTAPVYGDKTDWSAVKTRGEFTLSMDYILADKEKSMVDVSFQTSTGMSHSLTSLPYQRNYRTNVKGDLLTTGGTWTATIDTTWLSPDIVKVVEVADIKSANEIIEQYAQTTDNLEVKFVGVPNDSGLPTGEQSSQYRAILTTPLQQGANLGIEVMTNTNTLYVGDYIHQYKVTGETVDEYIDNTAKQATVNINVPANSGIQTLIINAPSKTVYVNGQLANNVGEITNIDAITSQNTLIIEPGQKVGKLTMRQGGLEIHGTVDEAIVPSEHGSISVRDCENLKESEVYNVLAPHIATGYMGVKDRTTEGLWDIVPIVCKIGTTPYGSLADAFKAVPTDAAAAATVITVVADANETFKTRGAELKKDQKVILDLNGYKLVGTSTDPGYTQYIYVENGGELTVKDSRTGGAIEYHDGYIENLTSGSGTGGSAITCHGCMTLESGTIENKTPDTKTNDLEGAIDMYTNAWGQAYSPADIVLNINGGVIKSNNANTVRLTSFSSQTYTTSVTANMNGGEVYGRDGFFIQGVSESYLNTNTLNLNGGKVYGTQAVRVMAFQNHANTSESKPVTIRIREGIDMQSNYFAQSTKEHWNKGICIDNLSGTYEQLMSYVNIIDAAVCKIGETYYSTLEAAVTAAAPLAQIYLVDNCAENVTVAKNIELFTDGFEFTGKLNPAAGFYTFDSNDINNLGDFSSWYPEGMDYITLAYPSAEVHDIDCTGDPVVFNSKPLETAYSFNAFDTKITREDTGMTDMVLMTKVLGEPDFSKLNNFDFDAFGQAFEELTEPQKKRVNEIISTMLPYLSWIADFEVHFNKDVAEGSLGVSGYYGSYAEAEGSGLGMDIDAPMEIKVGDTYRMLYEYGFVIPYAGICLPSVLSIAEHIALLMMLLVQK